MTSETSKPDMLLWVDVETTALEPREGQLLEIGMGVTGMDGSTLREFRTWLIRHKDIMLNPTTMHAVNMHTENHLIEQTFENGETKGATAIMIQTYLAALAGKYTLHPAGTNVDFDIKWLRSGLGLQLDSLHYRKLDMSTLRMVMRDLCLGAYAHQPTTHRVADCIRRDIDEYRSLLGAFGQMLDKDTDGGTGEKA